MKISAIFRGDGLKARTLRASSITFAGFGMQNIIRLTGNLALTRILFPEAFGLMALVQVVLTGLEMFSDVGMNASIIQSKRGHDRIFLNTAWTLQILRGLLLWSLVLLSAPWVAVFYEADVLGSILPVAGLTVLISGFNSTKLSTANKELLIGRVVLITIASLVVGLIVTVILALILKSVWALAIGGLVAPVLRMVASHVVLPGANNRVALEKAAVFEIFGFGQFIFLATMAGFLMSQGDRAILGKFVSLDDLALYQIAFFIATIPVMLQRRLAQKVLFPLFSKRHPSESVKNHRNTGRARFGIVGVAIILTSVLALVGNDLVVFLYDSRYEAAGPLLTLIALSRMPSLIIGGYGLMILAAGVSSQFAVLQILRAVVNTLLIFIGVYFYGAAGVAVAPFVTGLLIYPINVWFILKYRAWMPFQDLFWAIVSAGVIAGALWYNWDVIFVLFETSIVR